MKYADRKITEFLKAADRDLGSKKYKGEEMIPDYAQAVIIGKQLQAENKRLKEILKPFAEFSTLIDITRNETTITLQDFMKAKQALKGD